jgi:hypothetical protein
MGFSTSAHRDIVAKYPMILYTEDRRNELSPRNVRDGIGL